MLWIVLGYGYGIDCTMVGHDRMVSLLGWMDGWRVCFGWVDFVFSFSFWGVFSTGAGGCFFSVLFVLSFLLSFLLAGYDGVLAKRALVYSRVRGSGLINVHIPACDD